MSVHRSNQPDGDDKMDAAKSNRLYPSYTTVQLKEFLAADERLDDASRIKMQGEVDRRDAGLSVYRPTPVTHGGIAIPRLGRM